MDFRQLSALVAIADTGTFSAAAEVLHTVQSNVSTHIAHLERELGATLVNRGGGLTEEGELVVARSRRIQAELDALVADVVSLRDDVSGPVGIGVLGTTGRWLVPPLLLAVVAAHPKVRLTVLEGNTTALVPHLRSGRIDLAVVNLPVSEAEIELQPLFEEDLLLVVPVGHPLADRERVGVAELAEHELLLPPQGTSIRIELDRAAVAAGVTLRAQAELDGIRLIASLAFEGYGAGVLPASAVPGWLAGDWRRITIDDLPRRAVALAHRRHGMLSAPARAVEELLPKVVADGAAGQPGVYTLV